MGFPYIPETEEEIRRKQAMSYYDMNHGGMPKENPLQDVLKQLMGGAGPRGATFAGRVIPQGQSPNLKQLLTQPPQESPDAEGMGAIMAGASPLAGKVLTAAEKKMYEKMSPTQRSVRAPQDFKRRLAGEHVPPLGEALPPRPSYPPLGGENQEQTAALMALFESMMNGRK